jgi:broad specificity phosphatase PhoE
MRFYLIRHGESEGNARAIHQDSTTPLSQIGKFQANLMARRFSKINVDVILSSDYMRARQTAEAISSVINKPVEENMLLREIRRPNELIGKSIHDDGVMLIKQEIANHRDDPAWHYSDEENFSDYYLRGKQCLQMLSQLDANNVAVVTHGFFLCMLISCIIFENDLTPLLFQKIYRQFHNQNTGITMCDFENNHWQLVTWNDHSHLG